MFLEELGKPKGGQSVTEEFASSAFREDSFSTSLAYYLLTGRKGAQLLRDETDSKLVLARHPHINNRLMVFPELEGNGSMTAKLLPELPTFKGGIQLARYTEEDIKQLLRALSLSASTSKSIEIRQIDEQVMDWKYPVRVLDTKKTGTMQGQDFEKIRNKFNKVNDRLTIMPLKDPNALAAMRASLMFWVGAMIYSGHETGHSLTEFYDTLFRIIKKQPALLDGFVVMDGAEPAGFTIWDKARNGVANSLATLSRRSIKGMSEFQNVSACRILADQGVTSYNLGGSESQGVDTHKMEYHPERSASLASYEVVVVNTFINGLRGKTLPKF